MSSASSPTTAPCSPEVRASEERHHHLHHPLGDRVWALRSSVTAYDGQYIALAERLGLPLVTSDARLAGSNGHTAVIESFAR